MKKTLLLMVAVLFSMGAFAQTYLWQEDFSSYSANDVPSGGTYKYVCVDGKSKSKIYEEKLAGGTSPELLVSKNGGSFSATIPLNGKSGDMTLSFQSNKTPSVAIAESGVTLGTSTKSGNNITYPVTVPASVTSITITFSNSTSSNARLDDIKLFQGEGKKAAGLSWGTASREVTIGSDSNKFPTLSNDNNLSVTYTSSDESVATINASGEVTLVAEGTTTISAAFEGNDEYDAQTVSYTLTVKGASSVDISNTPETAYTVAQAIDLITAGEGLDTKVYVKGIIVSIKEVSTSYGNATYYISDDGTSTNQITVFRGYYLDGTKFTSEDQIQDGDEVVVYGKLTKYYSTNEINTGNQIYSINGKSTGIKNIASQTANDAPAYNLAGQKVGKSYKGVVIQNGKKFVQK